MRRASAVPPSEGAEGGVAGGIAPSAEAQAARPRLRGRLTRTPREALVIERMAPYSLRDYGWMIEDRVRMLGVQLAQKCGHQNDEKQTDAQLGP